MLKSILTVLFVALLSSASRADVDIVTTIKPLQLIAQAVVRDHGRVSAILDPRQSPHHFTMSPSDRIALAQADMAMWVGPLLETFLADFIRQTAIKAKTITVIDTPNLQLHNLEGGQLDAHLWLNSANAVSIAAAVMERVVELDPANAAEYRRNLDDFSAQIALIDTQTAQRFRQPPNTRYGVYHNAYQYFERQFGLAHDMAILQDPEVQPSIRQIVQLRNQIEKLEPGCLLLEFDSSRELLNTVLNGRKPNLITVDLLGSSINSAENGYAEFITNLADDFYRCLYQ
ncbi:MAG: zinc ABC transporter substrate-binding protein [Pseudohongiellaceae bacterium]